MRLAWIAAVLAAACGEAAKPLPGPLDRVYMPTGLAVHRLDDGTARIVVASSNADLRYDDASGGAVLSIDPGGAATTFGVNVPSFAGELALALPADCPELSAPLAVFATRGSSTVNAVRIGPSGEVACDRCGVPLDGGTFSDPFAVGVACGGGRARAFVGHLRSRFGEAWISEWNLVTGEIRSGSIGAGPARAFAYDAARDRLYAMGLATGAPTPLRWIDLAGGCRIDLSPSAGGCAVGEASLPLAGGLELRSMALGRSSPGRRRAFLTGRYYDLASAALAGGRTNDLGGALIVVDLVDNARGGVDVEIVPTPPEGWGIGHGAQDVRVLPRLPGWADDRSDVVAALAVDDGTLAIYDDETGTLRQFGRREDLGVPELGHEPFGLAVDPVVVGSVARVYVGSFRQSFITPIEVPLDALDAATQLPPLTGGTP